MSKEDKTDIIVYQSEDGKFKLDVSFQDESVWLSQKQVAELFGVDRSVITKHIKNILSDKEVDEKSNVQKLHIANSDKPVSFYSLDIILSVGYRTNSAIAIRFRKWATQTLKEYMVKGFVMDDERLENNERINKAGYFDELVERVRKIRTSERLMYQKVTDIFAVTSYDYQPNSQEAKDFFATIQNKFHYAVTGQTAAKIIVDRIDSSKENAGLVHISGQQPTVKEAQIAKNYLNEDELKQLIYISEQFLSFAEFKAFRKQKMYMKVWKEKLDEMLRLNDLDILEGKGSISNEAMKEKVRIEMEKYRKLLGQNGDFLPELQQQSH